MPVASQLGPKIVDGKEKDVGPAGNDQGRDAQQEQKQAGRGGDDSTHGTVPLSRMLLQEVHLTLQNVAGGAGSQAD